MDTKITPALAISFLALIVSITVLIFGNNISSNFKRAQLVYHASKMEIKYPSYLKIDSLQKKDVIPDIYREIIIKNIGAKPSTDLKLVIELDGSIYDKDIRCVENIENATSKTNSEFDISLKRLTKNADVNCKFWLKQNTNTLTIKSIDDQGIMDVINDADIVETHYLRNISLASIFILTIFIIYLFFILPLRKVKNTLIETNLGLQNQVASLSNELEALQTDIDIEVEEDENPPVNILQRLRQIIEETQ